MTVAKLPGRPLDAGKSAAMLAAASDVFFERGFSAATVEAVAERAGVSKVTVYARFGDKAGLFEAMVRHVSDRMQSAYLHPDSLPPSLEAALVCFGKGLMSEVMSPRLIAFEQNLAGDLAHHPDLARRFYEAGPGQCRKDLATIIGKAVENGQLVVEDTMLAAADLYGLWQGFRMIEARFGMAATLTDLEIEAIVERGVAIFLRAYRP
jgi:TetR/AcrR family transcriptional regulator, mexJK operon transcriptional repressor